MNTKKCIYCGKLLPLEYFPVRGDGRYYTYCKKCKLDKKTERRLLIRKFVDDYKSRLGCEICGEKEIVCLDFHHKNPKDKKFGIGNACSSDRSIQSILEEISKCRVLCCNCHRKLHKYKGDEF